MNSVMQVAPPVVPVASARAGSVIVDGRRIRETSIELVLRRAAHPDAVLGDDERQRLLVRFRNRLRINFSEFDELFAAGDLRLAASDPGTGPLLSEVKRGDIYRAAAARLDDNSTMDDVLHVRRVYEIDMRSKMERPPQNAIAAAERFMPEERASHHYVRLLCSGRLANILVAEHKAQHGGANRYTAVSGQRTEGDLLERAPTDLRSYLRDRGFGRIRPVPKTCVAQLLACKSNTLFELGLIHLDLILRQPESKAAYEDMLVVKQISNCTDGDDLTTREGMARFSNEYCLERTRYPKDPETRRINVGRFLLESHVILDREIRAADPLDAAMLARYQLPLPPMPQEFADRLLQAQRKLKDDGRRDRKDRVEPLSDRLPEARFLAGSRIVDLAHDQECCTLAIAEASRLDTSGSVEVAFSYKAPIFDEDGRRLPGEQRRHWTLRNGNRVLEMIADLTGEVNDRRRLPGHGAHLDRYDTEWWLTYDRSEGIDGSDPRDPWLLPVIESLILYTGRGLPPALVKEQMAFARANGLDVNVAARLQKSLGWFEADQAKMARRVIVDLGLRPWPITELTHGMMIAQTSVSIMTTTGARPHEVFQIVRDPSRFYKLEGLPGNEVRYVFLAVPKNFDEPVPFVITPDDVKAVMRLERFAARRFHDGGLVAVTRPPNRLGAKCGDGRFVMNIGGLALDPTKLNPLVQLLFAGRHELEAYDLRHVFASYAEGAGIPLEIIAAWLNQKSLDITRYYAQAPRAARDRWALQFHSTVDLRELQMAGTGIADAERAAALDEVGALTSVPGGTCVSLGECPVRFSCVGCRSNAPDPGKRAEIEASMEAAGGLRDVWGRSGRVKAVVEQERAIERHRAVLREMDLIEAYRRMRDEVVEPDLEVCPVVPSRSTIA